MPQRKYDLEERRDFIRSLGVFAVSCVAAPASLACASRSAEAQAQRPSAIEITTPQEPGTRIHISGTIVDANGKPAPNVKMFVYHTDNTGFYSRPVNDPRQARLRGTLWSNAAGQYSFDTIKPAAYGDVTSPPAIHIHVHLQPPNAPEHWVESFYFADDPYLRRDPQQGRESGRFNNIISLSASDKGVLKGIRDFRIDLAAAERNRV